MPQIPLSQEGYGFTPQPGTPTATPAANALAEGFARVSNSFAELDTRQRENGQLAAAGAIDNDAALKLNDLRLKYAKDPDYATSFDRYQQEATQLRTDTLKRASDPGVAALVQHNFDHRATTTAISVKDAAVRIGNAAQDASIRGSVDDYVKGMASNPADWEQNLAMARGMIAGGARAGIYSPDQVTALTSNAVRTAITLRGATDPIGAAALMENNRGTLTASDLVGLTEHLTPRVQRMQAENAAQAVIGTGNPAAVSGDFADRTIGYESGGRAGAQNPLSSATGAGQFISGTWLPLIKSTMPDLAAGKSDAELLALRKDPAVSRQMVTTYAQQNAPILTAAGLDASSANLYLAHRLGPGDAVKVLKTSADTPLSSVLSNAVMSANPDLQGKSASDLTQTANARMAGVGGASTGTGYSIPDINTQLAAVKARTAGLPFEAQQRAESIVMGNYHQQQSLHAVDRTNLQRQVTDLSAGYEQGLTQPDIPEGKIRSLFPPEEADRMVDGLRVARTAGDLFTSTRFASAADDAAAMQQLTVPGSLSASTTRVQGGQLTGPGTVLPADGKAPAETPDVMRMRTQVAAKLAQLQSQKRTALAADPAAYVAAAPQLAELAKAIDPSRPETMQAYADASTTMQRQMGLPADKIRILTNAQVQTVATQLAKTDPATGDMGAALDQQAKQWGPQWQQVFGELVQHGDISPAYQVLGSMDAPAQATARQDMQRVLQFAGQKGGLQSLKKDAPPDEVKAIESGLDATMAPFRDTVKYNQGGVQLLSTVRGAVEHLATYYAMQGESGSKALTHAYTGIIDAKYDIDGTMRVPKGVLPITQLAARNVQNGLTAADLAPVPGNPNLTPAERSDIMVQAARRGMWVPNANDTGLVLMGQMREGSVLPIRRADGTAVSITFGALSDLAHPAQPSISTPDPRIDPMPGAMP